MSADGEMQRLAASSRWGLRSFLIQIVRDKKEDSRNRIEWASACSTVDSAKNFQRT
jgi:hypothetical protein